MSSSLMAVDPGSEYWRVRQEMITDVDRFDVPALHINSWHEPVVATSAVHHSARRPSVLVLPVLDTP